MGVPRVVRVVVCLLAASCAGAPPPAVAPPAAPVPERITFPERGLIIRGPAEVVAGFHHLPAAEGPVFRLDRPGAVLDLTGATLVGHDARELPDPDAYVGVCVEVVDAPGAIVRGGSIRGFKVAVRVVNSPGAVIEDVDASGNFRQRLGSTVDREDAADWLWPHANDGGEWESRYGAGISATASPGLTVRRCVVNRGQNGLLLARCDRARVHDNDFSFNSGWGVALWRTCDAVVARNRMDFCVRGYSHGIYDRGQDSTGLLVFEQCSGNLFALNSATHGGDGFFLYAGNETLRETGTGGCNDNVVWRNDFSHAVANGIEATFSTGNVFQENRLDDCRHGIWAGYSADSRFVANRIVGCDNGVSIEHGHRNVIEGNEIRDNGTGVHLWWDEDPDLAASAFGRSRELRSFHNRVGPDNVLSGNRVDVLLVDDQDSIFAGNVFDGASARIELRGEIGEALLTAQVVGDAFTIHADHRGTVFVDSDVDPVVTGGGLVVRRADWPDHLALPGPSTGGLSLDEATLPGTMDPFLPPDAPRGRRYILVDPWGPVDPRQSRLFPSRMDAAGAARFSVLGVDGSFRVVRVTEGFTAEPAQGELPATLTVRRAAGGGGVAAFEVEVEAAGTRHGASGTLFDAVWDVRFFRWEKDPREDAEAWRALLAGEPTERRRLDALSFQWGGGVVSAAVGADRFATLATSQVELPAGRYRLRTVSDDGIRVRIDGRTVIEDWTHHGPTPHEVDVDLEAGVHHLHVEHFEIDGWAVLEVTLVPL